MPVIFEVDDQTAAAIKGVAEKYHMPLEVTILRLLQVGLRELLGDAPGIMELRVKGPGKAAADEAFTQIYGHPPNEGPKAGGQGDPETPRGRMLRLRGMIDSARETEGGGQPE